MSERLLPVLLSLVEQHFQAFSKPLRVNLAALTVAFLSVLAGIRSGYGGLSLSALARALPTAGLPHSRENRLLRFLANPRIDFRAMTTSLVSLMLTNRTGICPILFDQTKVGNAQALLAAAPYAGRALPLSVYTFEYPLREPALKSQNQLEHLFILDVETSLPPGLKAVWIADRGYARASLLAQSQLEERWYIIRGRGNTIISHQSRRLKLKELKPKKAVALRYENVRYQMKQQVLLDVVVYWESTFSEPWYLLTPVEMRSAFSEKQVVDLYRERMQVEQSFRDFKTHLGLRGLKLQTAVAARMGRLILAFCLAYILCVLLGEGPLGEEARLAFEIPRRIPRHGTTRTLSALCLSMLMLSHPTWTARSLHHLLQIIQQAIHQKPWLPTSVLLRTPRPP